MLTPREIDQLRSRKDRTPRERANLDFRVAQKIKKELNELKDINRALQLIPSRNVKRVLNDEMVASLFKLTERVLDIMGYTPIEKGPDGQIFAYVLKEPSSKDRNSQKFEIEIRPPNKDEVARDMLLDEHLKELQKFTCPENRIPLTGFLANLPNLNRAVYDEGYELYRDWRNRWNYHPDQ